jgi:hypothetical protein
LRRRTAPELTMGNQLNAVLRNVLEDGGRGGVGGGVGEERRGGETGDNKRVSGSTRCSLVIWIASPSALRLHQEDDRGLIFLV